MTDTATPAPSPQIAPFLPSFRLPRPLATDETHSVALRWVASRALTLMLLVGLEHDVTGDVNYYGRTLHILFNGGNVQNTFAEYPLPVVGLLLIPFVLGALNQVAFATLFVLGMLAVDAAFTMLLWRMDGRRRGEAVNLWLWFVPCVGPMAFFRFDLVPAALAGAAVLAAARRPGLCAVLTAIGSGLKLWPALMLPTFLLRPRDRRPVLTWFGFSGGAILALCLLIGGWDRTLSPLRWQSRRGLQIESVTATPLMIVRAFTPGHWRVRVSKYQAYEIFGPWVSPFVKLTTFFTVVGLIVLGVLWWRAHNAPAVSAEALGWMFFATALVVTITNKTLSPQYILWLGGPLAALYCRFPADPVVRRAGRCLLAIALLTQLLFPLMYDMLTGSSWTQIPAVGVLTARNGLLIYLTWLACTQVWRIGITTPAAPDMAEVH